MGMGTAVAGQFKVDPVDPTAIHTKGMDNPYMDGEPTGKNLEVHFAGNLIDYYIVYLLLNDVDNIYVTIPPCYYCGDCMYVACRWGHVQGGHAQWQNHG
jgi:hypothetical protein